MIHQPWQERGKDMSHLSEEQLDQIIAAERAREQEPLNEWRTIAARAREEGLIRESKWSRPRGSSQPWLQAAAALGRAVTDYKRAAQFIAASNTSVGTQDSVDYYTARAVALDKIVNATE